MTKRFSLLTRKEEKRNFRKAFLYGFLTILLGMALFFLGVPALIKMAVFIGSLNSSSTPIERSDNLSPSPPTFKPVFEATNSAELSLYGFAEAESTIKLFLNGKEKEVIADNDGNFTFNEIKLKLGKNEFYAFATDKAGNESNISKRITVFYENEPPELEISSPEDGSTFWEEDKQIDILGKTDPDANLLINDHFVVVNQEGGFSYQISLTEGENEIKVIATDKAGNETERTIKVNYSP